MLLLLLRQRTSTPPGPVSASGRYPFPTRRRRR